ncbi:hypothetical protein QEH57_07255 [Pelagicoccus sp. SDUM812005]|nr:hypothetical protein [Pelagicoccus sp. SDUM812005]
MAASFSIAERDGNLLADVLLVDEMYTEQARLESVVDQWRQRNPRGVVGGIDDMQRRSMAGFDLVLNTEIGLREAAYEAGVSLLGERFALLRAGFRSPAELGDLSGFVGLVPALVMVGGTDAFGFLPRVLDALAAIETVPFAPVVIGPGEVDLGAFAAGRAYAGISSEEVAAWMRFCRLGVIGCGTSLYEAAAMELPFVGVSVVDNQTATARKVAAHWRMPVLHLEGGTDGPLDLGDPVADLLGRKRESYSEVDTEGARRVADALEVLLAERRSG